jgi:hypothetical protein
MQNDKIVANFVLAVRVFWCQMLKRESLSGERERINNPGLTITNEN